MIDETLYSQIEDALYENDETAARTLLKQFPKLLQDEGPDLMLHAAMRDNVEAVALLVKLGVDVNVPTGPPDPEGVIVSAAGEGAKNVVRWLLEHGAEPNHFKDGQKRCLALARAARNNHLEVVKLLVDHGADVNAIAADKSALSWAITYNRPDIAAYLRSKGAREPWEIQGTKPLDAVDSILQHVEKTLGKPEPLSLQEIVPGDPSLSIHIVRRKRKLALVTHGMSSRPMAVPPGKERYQYAELVIYLPADWPLSAEALNDPNNYWPVEWLRRIAHYPFENDTWLGGPPAIIGNGEPPEPLAPGTRQTCILLVGEQSAFGQLRLADGRFVKFYTLFPLYTEERDLEKARGVEHLLELFDKRGIDTVVDTSRPNVALSAEKRKKK